MRGSGCPRCAGVAKLTNEEFLVRAREIHGDKYEYLTSYKHAIAHIQIRCCNCTHIFKQMPNNHINFEQGCPRCVRRISESENVWLDELDISVEHRQISVPEFHDNRFKVDALVDRTVYEFYGTYYHGDPRKYAREEINGKCGRTMGDLYDATIARYDRLISFGYTVKFVWELDRDAGALFSERHPHEHADLSPPMRRDRTVVNPPT